MKLPRLRYLYVIKGRENFETIELPSLIQVLKYFDRLDIQRYENMIYTDLLGNRIVVMSAERERVYLSFQNNVTTLWDSKIAHLRDILLKDSSEEVEIGDVGNIPYPIYKTVPKEIARFVLAYYVEYEKLPQKYREMWSREFPNKFFD
jgi:hypothetical protein